MAVVEEKEVTGRDRLGVTGDMALAAKCGAGGTFDDTVRPLA